MNRQYEEAEFLRPGNIVVIDGEPWEVLANRLESDGGDPGVYSRQWMVLDLRNELSGMCTQKTPTPGQDFELAHLNDVRLEFLYRGQDAFHFMDMSTMEPVRIPAEQLAHVAPELSDGDVVDARAFDGRPLPRTIRHRDAPSSP